MDWLITTGFKLLLIIILIFLSLKIARILINRVFASLTKDGLAGESKKRADTLSSLIRNIVSVIIISIGLVMVLGQLGIQIGPILAAAGIAGVAIGFGAQHLVQDIISGFFILLEDEIRVGDVIEIAGKGGLVENVSLRMTTLRDLAGNVHYIRNGQIDIVTNMTKEFSYYVFDIGVAYRENVDEVMEIIREIDEDIRLDPQFKDDILEPMEIMGLDKFADSAVIIKARIKTKPIKQWRVAREFNRRLKKTFDEHHIEIPFPHLTIYAGENKEGQAASFKLSLNGKNAAIGG
nr:mechanosensitive ion channel family protein [candidate division Zixibacteria bacterium]